MKKLDKYLSALKRVIMQVIEPVFIGIIAGVSFALFIKYTNFTLISILVLALIASIIETYLKRKYTKQCPECGRYLGKNKK